MRPADLTIAEACAVLNPPVAEDDLAAIIRALHWQPAGVRHNGFPGRPKPTYDARELMRLHAALAPWLGR